MTALRAFEAVIRLGTLSAAARELHVTPAAISHRLKDLEAAAGKQLVYRQAGVFRPTVLGTEIIDGLGDAFTRIRRADRLLRSSMTGTLRISAAYSFAVLWLSARVMQFGTRHPEIDLHIEPSHSPKDQDDADVVIVHSDKRPDMGQWTLLFEDTCGVLGRADHPFLSGAAPPLGDLAKADLIHIAHRNGPQSGEFSWRQWCAQLGLVGLDLGRGARVSAEHLAVEMILRSPSLALVSTFSAQDHIASGALRVLPGSTVSSNRGYWMMTCAQGGNERLVKEFENWLIKEVISGLSPEA